MKNYQYMSKKELIGELMYRDTEVECLSEELDSLYASNAELCETMKKVGEAFKPYILEDEESWD